MRRKYIFHIIILLLTATQLACVSMPIPLVKSNLPKINFVEIHGNFDVFVYKPLKVIMEEPDIGDFNYEQITKESKKPDVKTKLENVVEENRFKNNILNNLTAKFANSSNPTITIIRQGSREEDSRFNSHISNNATTATIRVYLTFEPKFIAGNLIFNAKVKIYTESDALIFKDILSYRVSSIQSSQVPGIVGDISDSIARQLNQVFSYFN